MKLSAQESNTSPTTATTTTSSTSSSEFQGGSLNITVSAHEDINEIPYETARFDQLSAENFPLIVTYNAFLRMADHSLSSPFFALNDQRSPIDLFRFESFYYPRLGETTGRGRFKVCIYMYKYI